MLVSLGGPGRSCAGASPVSLCGTASTRNAGAITTRGGRPPTLAAIAMVTGHLGRGFGRGDAMAVALAGPTRATVCPTLGPVSASRVTCLGSV